MRDQAEFRYGGEDGLERPADAATASDADWAGYLFFRTNPKGPHRERWVHAWGCRQWFVLERNTVTHEISQTGQRAPGGFEDEGAEAGK